MYLIMASNLLVIPPQLNCNIVSDVASLGVCDCVPLCVSTVDWGACAFSEFCENSVRFDDIRFWFCMQQGATYDIDHCWADSRFEHFRRSDGTHHSITLVATYCYTEPRLICFFANRAIPHRSGILRHRPLSVEHWAAGKDCSGFEKIRKKSFHWFLLLFLLSNQKNPYFSLFSRTNSL